MTYATQKSAAHNLKFFEPPGPAEVVRPPVCCSTALRQHSSTLSLRRWPVPHSSLELQHTVSTDKVLDPIGPGKNHAGTRAFHL